MVRFRFEIEIHNKVDEQEKGRNPSLELLPSQN